MQVEIDYIAMFLSVVAVVAVVVAAAAAVAAAAGGERSISK